MDGSVVLQLLIGSVPVILGVFLIVESFKVYGWTNGTSWLTSPRVGISAGIILGLIAMVGELYPPAALYIATAALYFFGGLVAGLFYEMVGGAILIRVQAVLDALFGVEE